MGRKRSHQVVIRLFWGAHFGRGRRGGGGGMDRREGMGRKRRYGAVIQRARVGQLGPRKRLHIETRGAEA
eukprot:360653-Chlamydomonas_euryale.AAC.2